MEFIVLLVGDVQQREAQGQVQFPFNMVKIRPEDTTSRHSSHFVYEERQCKLKPNTCMLRIWPTNIKKQITMTWWNYNPFTCKTDFPVQETNQHSEKTSKRLTERTQTMDWNAGPCEATHLQQQIHLERKRNANQLCFLLTCY